MSNFDSRMARYEELVRKRESDGLSHDEEVEFDDLMASFSPQSQRPSPYASMPVSGSAPAAPTVTATPKAAPAQATASPAAPPIVAPPRRARSPRSTKVSAGLPQLSSGPFGTIAHAAFQSIRQARKAADMKPKAPADDERSMKPGASNDEGFLKDIKEILDDILESVKTMATSAHKTPASTPPAITPNKQQVVRH